MLPDGRYDALVVDADEDDEGNVTLSITIIAGEHKGEVLDLRASGLGRDPLDLLAEPCTLVVAGSTPSVEFERR